MRRDWGEPAYQYAALIGIGRGANSPAPLVEEACPSPIPVLALRGLFGRLFARMIQVYSFLLADSHCKAGAVALSGESGHSPLFREPMGHSSKSGSHRCHLAAALLVDISTKGPLAC